MILLFFFRTRLGQILQCQCNSYNCYELSETFFFIYWLRCVSKVLHLFLGYTNTTFLESLKFQLLLRLWLKVFQKITFLGMAHCIYYFIFLDIPLPLTIKQMLH